MLASPPTPEMMAVMLDQCPLTADHFRLSVPVPGTFAVWVLSREGKHSLVIPRGYGGPEGNFARSEQCERPCLNLVTTLAQIILNRSVHSGSVLSVTIQTTLGDFVIYAFGVPVRCDICGCPVERDSGFTLSARQIVSTPHYWQIRYEHNKTRWQAMGVPFDQYKTQEEIRNSEIGIVLGFGSDWLVCDDCISHFPADREAARRFALVWWKDRNVTVPAEWAAKPSDVNMG
jgi:hypothetical protein